MNEMFYRVILDENDQEAEKIIYSREKISEILRVEGYSDEEINKFFMTLKSLGVLKTYSPEFDGVDLSDTEKGMISESSDKFLTSLKTIFVKKRGK